MSFRRRTPAFLTFLTALAVLPGWAVAQGSAPAAFTVRIAASALAEPFTGRVVVYLTKGRGEPRFGPDWFHPEPIYSAGFERVAPGEPMELTDANTVGFPGRFSALPAGEYRLQAVADRSLGGRAIGTSPGNVYSDVVTATVGPGSAPVSILCERVVPERTFKDTVHVRGVHLRSPLLSRFHGRDTFLNAAVMLPEAYTSDPSRRFPVLYEVPGFGGSSWSFSGRETTRGTDRGGEPFLHVTLDPNCPTGHHVFADSANNGPWGRALTTELIPYIEKTYRAIGKPWARFVAGHSSGGWSSLWLQVTYPYLFGGTWSTSPDPVDFRDFQRIDLYQAGVNMFTDEKGQPRPIARIGDRATLFYRAFSDMERPIRGEQLGSFEAVFSPRGKDGSPVKLWDRDTGAVDPEVARAWRKYDISHTLRTRWKTLRPKLKGKLHVFCGDMDNFYLEGAVKRLAVDLRKLGSDAEVELVPGDHGSMMAPALRSRIDRAIAQQYRRGRSKAGAAAAGR
jgi:S-formylglutathione hydrolase FrmB